MLPAITIEAETLFDNMKFYPKQKAEVRRFRWPLDQEVFFANRKPGGYMEMIFDVPEKGVYNVLLYFMTIKNHAIVDVELDWLPVGRGFDTSSLAIMERQFSVGARELDKGPHKLRITAVDNNKKEGTLVYTTKDMALEERNIGYFISLDAIVLEKFSLDEGVSPLK